MSDDREELYLCLLYLYRSVKSLCDFSSSHSIHRPPGSNMFKWFKFDDGEVTEAKIDDDEVR